MDRTHVSLSALVFLTAISLLLIGMPSAFAQGSAAVPPELLPEGLKGVEIQESFVPAGSFPEAGVVHALQGTLVVVHRASGKAYVAGKGDPIHENDELFTLADSRCRIRLLSDDVVNMAPDTRFSLDQFLDQPQLAEKTSVFSMLKGKAVFYALRLFRYKETRFKVKTPTAIVGVRGTQFGVHVFWMDEKQAAGRGVRVADRGARLSSYLAQTGAGDAPSSGTIVACGDGLLDVTDPATGDRLAQVNPNEDFNSFTGEKTFDPMNRTLNGIVADATVQENGEGQGTGDTGGEGGTGGDQETGTPLSGEDTGEGTGDTTDITDLTTDVTTQQTGEETGSEGSQQDDYPSHRYGYFNTILTANAGTGGYYFTTGLANLNSTGMAEGRREGVDVGDVYYDGTGAPGIKQITGLTHNGNTVNSGVPVDVEYWLYGHDAYMIWGGWYQPEAMINTGSGIEHFFDYRGYFFVGDHTTDAQMAALHSSLGAVTYSGDAWGKHYQQSSGTAMTGSFSAQVNFSSPSVTDFDMYVSGGGHSAQIEDAQGGFTGNSSQFVINTATGSWHVDGMSASYKDARGGLYGSEAQKMGVIWVMKESSGSPNTAWGMCVGGR